jgi:hypothetical protein
VEDFSVALEAHAPEADRITDPGRDSTDAFEAFTEFVAAQHGVAGSGPGIWTARISVEAEMPASALSRAEKMIRDAAAEAGLPLWPFIRAEVVLGELLAETLIVPPRLPDLVSAAEAAEVLGVSRQRLHQLATEDPGFPSPLYELAVGRLWARPAIENFNATWQRRGGWPSGRRRRRDIRPSLLDMRPVEFEHLIRRLFEALGMSSWVTQESRDAGIDALVINEDPIMGGLSIIQAKRYSKIVGLEAVHALAGVMEDKRAAKGVLVTTSWFGRASQDFAARNGRIELIDGNTLVRLLREHLAVDTQIGSGKLPAAHTESTSQSTP